MGLEDTIMKKAITLISISLILFGLAACSSVANIDPGTAQAADSLLPTDYDNALPTTLQLVVGTLKLEGTTNEVGPETASTLLPLWKAAKSLSSSDSTAPEELNALFKQIEETMTPEQIQAIAALKLTQQDMTQIAQEMGLGLGAGAGSFSNMTSDQQATAQAARQSGQGFPGGMPGMEGAPPGGAQGIIGGDMPPADTTGQTSVNRSAGGNGAAMYDVVIQYLEGKVNSGLSNQ